MTITPTASFNNSVPIIQQHKFFVNKQLVVFRQRPFSSTSSSSNSVILEEKEERGNEPEPLFSSSRGCKGCGKEEPERGCNGEGRIQGGIATVPGFGWWPIKAYRPCPGFVASGGRYQRRGQSMDDMASGEVKKPKKVVPKETNSDEIQSSKKKKKQGPRKFKR